MNTLSILRSPARRIVLASAAACVAITLLVSVLPFIDFAYRSEGAHLAIETAASLIALLTGVLIMGRFARERGLSDLLLAAALLLLAGTNLVFSTLPSMFAGLPSRFEVWSPLAGRVIAAVALGLAALAPEREIVRPRRALLRASVAVVAALVAIGVGVSLLVPVLPTGIDPALSPEASGRPRVVGPAILLGLYLFAMLVYLVAALGFVRRAERTGDELMLWFTAGAVVAAFSRLNYFLFPSSYSEWVYTGDLLRLAFYLLLLAGALREITSYQRRLAEAAVYEERRRIARELHDGLAQDLAFISSQSRRLRGGARAEVAKAIAQTADRAVEESRSAIAALTRPVDEPLEVSLARAAEEVARRGGAEVQVKADHGIAPSPHVREALLRIVREAVGNAVRHGHARHVLVSLNTRDGLSLAVRDDGIGFSTDAAGSRGFGLTSMRERVEALGGSLSLSSTSGRGTALEVRIP